MEGQITKFWQKQQTKKKTCLLILLIVSQLFLMLFSFANCKNNCRRSWQYAHPCLSNGSLYCCSRYDPFNDCSNAAECKFDNSMCYWLMISSILVGVGLLASLINFFIFSHKMLLGQGSQKERLIKTLIGDVSERKHIDQSLLTMQ